jgi:polygalacturonase
MQIRRRDFIRTGLAASAFGASRRGWAAQIGGDESPARTLSSGWSQVPGILANIVPPTFPDRDFVITSYGSTGDLGANCAPALAAAIKACSNAGGGRVVVPAGAWVSKGPIHLLSNVNLYLEAGADITFGSKPEDYLPLQVVRWQGIRCFNYSPLIYAYQQKNIAITGSGSFFGQGKEIWNRWTKISDPDFALLEKMAEDGVPVEDRRFGTHHFLRPAMFAPYDCQNILVQGVSFRDSPFWTMQPTFCSNVTILDVTVTPGAENDDGCDPDSCMNVLVAGCNFSTVDDNISIKAGMLPDALGLPGCENIVVQNCNCLRSAWSGLTIGSQVGGTIRNVFMENCTVNNCINAHFIKGHANLGGAVENIYFRSNQVYTCDSIFAVIPDAYTGAGTLGPPAFSNLNMQEVACLESTYLPLSFLGDPSLPIRGVNLSSIAIKATKSSHVYQIVNTVDLAASDITLNGIAVQVDG